MKLMEAFALALEMHRAGRMDEADAIYREILAQRPGNADALHLVGMIEHQRCNHASSETFIRQAIAIHPNNPLYHNNLANAQLALGKTAEAIEAYRRCLALNPQLHETWHNLGIAQQSIGQFAPAIRSFERSIALQPRDARPHLNAAGVLRAMGRLEDSVACYQRGIQLAPDDAIAYSKLGLVLVMLRRGTEAIAACEQAVRLQPDNPETHHALACILEAEGRREEAIAHHRRALELMPSSPTAQFDLAAATGEAPPASAPHAYVIGLFDNYAASFDNHLTIVLGYRTPAALAELTKTVEPRTKLDVLDLGCGTGLAGVAFKPMAKTLTGVDLSPRMLDHAYARKVYDQLFAADLVNFLRPRDGNQQYDLIVCADTLVYLGDLRELFLLMAAVLRPGGLFVFSVEAHEGESFVLTPKRRYTHSIAYLRALAAEAGLREAAGESTKLRVENDTDVMGWLMALRKPAAEWNRSE